MTILGSCTSKSSTIILSKILLYRWARLFLQSLHTQQLHARQGSEGSQPFHSHIPVMCHDKTRNDQHSVAHSNVCMFRRCCTGTSGDTQCRTCCADDSMLCGQDRGSQCASGGFYTDNKGDHWSPWCLHTMKSADQVIH